MTCESEKLSLSFSLEMLINLNENFLHEVFLKIEMFEMS